MLKAVFIFLILFYLPIFGDKIYVKNYFENGQIKSEGWMSNNEKDGYWFTYHENGSKKEEGHFKNNKKTKWWINYDNQSKIERKCEFENNLMNGFCIIYNNGEPIRGEKFVKGKKIKQWNSLSEFRKDNFIAFIK
jgi:antitoxin component YwqK of YwqJK toxin-antitoxin module